MIHQSAKTERGQGRVKSTTKVTTYLLEHLITSTLVRVVNEGHFSVRLKLGRVSEIHGCSESRRGRTFLISTSEASDWMPSVL